MKATVLALLLGLLLVAPAYADSASASGDVHVAQTLGDRELTVTLRRVTGVPGPLHVDVLTHAGSPAGTLRLSITGPGSAEGTAVALGARPGSYGGDLRVDTAGRWELAIDDGQRVARIPFVVSAQPISPPEQAVYLGFLLAGVGLVATIVVATRSRRGWWAMIPVGGAIAGLAVAITGAVLSTTLPLPPQPGTQLDADGVNTTDPYRLAQPLTGDYSRQPANLSLSPTSVATQKPLDFTLALTDGATGRPVDDLMVHDSALLHLIVIGPSGQLWHLHPIRVAPGVFQFPLTLPVAGHYALSAEIARTGGGVQLVRSTTGIDATGDNTVATQQTEPDVHVTVPDFTAGQPGTIDAHVGAAADLQPWLGMLGHLIAVGPLGPGGAQAAPVWVHAHSMGGDMTGMAMAAGSMGGLMPVNGDSAPDETVAAYGPDVAFTYTFPLPGDYQAWIQVERNYRVETIPLTVHVAPAPVAKQGKHDVTARLVDTGTVELDVTPSAGATVSVQAVMPTTGYATGEIPAVATDTGKFRVTGLPLMMPGQWEIVTTVRDQSGVDEHVSPVTVTG
ncbi:hypothetical protein [Kutzneria sp. CA-103260]|uniref:hypothetical protein n=1 Tax=Kutzneria sp. CA-103260 TaxID=2802641 RepID=UPI001BA7ACEB|nr:hypothetical protein [Kutzneria sp. CA-103260]QUQ62452.1 YtkA-like protein [Kutzneria sp. CA-103260]